MSQVRAVLFYDSAWDGTAYFGGDPGQMVFNRDISFEQLLEKIYAKKGKDKQKVVLNLHFMWMNRDGRTIRLPITDDDDLQYAFGEDPLVIYVGCSDRTNSSTHQQKPSMDCPTSNIADNPSIQDSDLLPRVDADFDDSDLREVLNGNMVHDCFTADDSNDINDKGDRRNDDNDDYLSDWEKDDDGDGADMNCTPVDVGVHELPGMEKHTFPNERIYCLSGSYKCNDLSEGAIFRNKEVMKHAICKYDLENKLSVYMPNSNNKRFEVECTEKGCEFAFRARRGEKGFPIWHVTHFQAKCTCLFDPDRVEHRQVNSKLIGTMFSTRVSEAKFAPANIMSEVRARFAIQLLYSKAWRALQHAKDIAYGTHEDSWQLLPSYLHMLRETNPGTLIALKTDTSNRFMYSFFCLGQCIEGFKKYIRPVVAMDATHMKERSTGIIFVALGMDGSDCIYPLAFGFAPKEEVPSWTWFLCRLREAIGLREDMVIVTDRGTSIPPAVREVYPNVPHVFCYHHLKENLLKYCRRRKDVQEALRVAAYTHSREECDRLLQGLSSSCPNIYNELVALGVKKWTKSYCPRRRYNIMTTNIAESVNRAILPARRLPITAAHEFLRGMIQRWFCARLEAANKLQSSITAGAVDNINQMSAEVAKCDVFPIAQSVKYHIKHSELGDGIIQVEERTCTCKRWQMDQFPCLHAVAYSRFVRVRVSGLCHEYYSKEFLQGAYGIAVNPVPSKEAWVVCNTKVLPMAEHRQAGRPKEKRFRPPSEGARSKKCSKCGENGHTFRRCTNRPVSSNGSTSGVGNGGATNVRTPRVMRCSRCKVAGHTVRKCPQSTPFVNVTEDMSSHVNSPQLACGQATQSETINTPETVHV